MKLYPIFLKLKNRKCLVIGGGPVAERKVKDLIGAGGDVTVISPDLTRGLNNLASRGKISCERRKYRQGDLGGFFLVIVSTNSKKANRRAYIEAEKQKVLINSVDDRQNSGFLTPSLVRRGNLQIAISTSGKSPYLAKKLREFFERRLYPGLDRELETLHERRVKIIKEAKKNGKLKGKKFEQILAPEVKKILKRMDKR